MLFVYSLFIYLIVPFLPFYLLKRSYKHKEYLLFWRERFGFGLSKNTENKPVIWLHSVSVGETRAMTKIIEILRNRYPSFKILITIMTPTGRQAANKLYPDALIHYIPYDLPYAVKNFYLNFKPKVGLIMETEIWPNLVHYGKIYKTPLFLVNARLSSKSFNAYNKIRFFISPILNCFSGILCQDNTTKNNFLALGYHNSIEVVGSTKFDIGSGNLNITKFVKMKGRIPNKKVAVFFSTKEDEELQIINNLPQEVSYLVIIIPRHLERFVLVESLLLKNNIKYQKRSTCTEIDSDTIVLLGDSMGEMLDYYFICDLAIVGGSFTNNGGQNLLEPIFLQKPVIFGQSMHNFQTIADNALLFNCANQVRDMADCFVKINEILADDKKYAILASNCSKFIKEFTGASEKIVNTVSNSLK